MGLTTLNQLIILRLKIYMDTRVSEVVQHKYNSVGEVVTKPLQNQNPHQNQHAVMQQGHNAKTIPVKFGCMKKILHGKCEKPLDVCTVTMRRLCYRLPEL